MRWDSVWGVYGRQCVQGSTSSFVVDVVAVAAVVAEVVIEVVGDVELTTVVVAVVMVNCVVVRPADYV